MVPNEKKGRDYKFEFIRVLAIFLVVGSHSLNVLQPDGTAFKDFCIKLISTCFVTCNALFFFISGKFALQKKVEDGEYTNYYSKKFFHVIFPVLVYMVIYTIYDVWSKTHSLEGIGKTIIDNIIFNYNAGHHFWFMYVIVGHLMLAPFMAKILVGLSRREAMIFVGIGILYNTAYAYTPLFTQVPVAWVYPLGLWAIYFYLGGCYDKIIQTDRDRKIILILGTAGLIIIFLKMYFSSYQSFICDLMPSFTFFSLMVYQILQKFHTDNKKIQSFIIFLGKRAFGVYLFHIIVIWEVLPSLSFTTTYPNVISLFAVMVIVFIISIIVSYLIELILLAPIQKQGVYLIKKTFSGKQPD